MSAGYVPRCPCGTRRDRETLLCPEGCDVHRKPHQRLISEEFAGRRRERTASRSARAALPTVEEASLGAEIAYAGKSAGAAWRARRFVV